MLSELDRARVARAASIEALVLYSSVGSAPWWSQTALMDHHAHQSVLFALACDNVDRVQRCCARCGVGPMDECETECPG